MAPPHPQYRVDSRTEARSSQSPREAIGDINMSPYAVGALVCAGLAIILIVLFITLAIKFRAKEKRLRERFSRTYDEVMDDQEQELLDDNIQPADVDEVGRYIFYIYSNHFKEKRLRKQFLRTYNEVMDDQELVTRVVG